MIPFSPFEKRYLDEHYAQIGSSGLGTVTSVALSGGTTGFSFSGSPITGAGTITMGVSDAATIRTALGLGTLATQSGTFSGTSSGTNTGDQSLFGTIAVSGQSNVVADAANDTLTLVAGSNVTITTDAATDTITIAATGGASYTDEEAQDAVGTILADSSTIDFTYTDGTPEITASVIQAGLDHGSIGGLADDDHTQYHNDSRANTWLATKSTSDLTEGSNLYHTSERVDDRVAALIQNGTGIAWTYDDGANTLTGNVSITQYTDEMAQDAIGAMVADTTTINATYTDGTPELKFDVIANTSTQKIEVAKNSGAVVGTRKQLNFIEGSNVTLTVADDAGNDQVDITIAASVTGGSGDVTGPGSATDNALARFDGTGGKTIQNGSATLSDAGDLTLESADAGAAAGPVITLYRNSASPAASDVIGKLLLQGEDSAGNTQDYAAIQGVITDPTSTSEDAEIQMLTTAAGTTAKRMALDASQMYTWNDAAANQGVVSSEHWIVQSADRTLTNTTATQFLFNDITNGTLTLPTGRYFFECLIYLTTMSATGGNAFFTFLGAGTATTGTGLYNVVGVDNNSPNAGQTQTGSLAIGHQTPTPMLTATTGTGMKALMNGMFTITAAGTIIPSIDLQNAAAAVFKAGSYFRCHRVGSDSTNYVGNWS